MSFAAAASALQRLRLQGYGCTSYGTHQLRHAPATARTSYGMHQLRQSCGMPYRASLASPPQLQPSQLQPSQLQPSQLQPSQLQPSLCSLRLYSLRSLRSLGGRGMPWHAVQRSRCTRLLRLSPSQPPPLVLRILYWFG